MHTITPCRMKKLKDYMKARDDEQLEIQSEKLKVATQKPEEQPIRKTCQTFKMKSSKLQR